MEILKRLMCEENGQGLVEYALLLGLIAVLAISALTAMGGSVLSIYGKVVGAARWCLIQMNGRY